MTMTVRQALEHVSFADVYQKEAAKEAAKAKKEYGDGWENYHCPRSDENPVLNGVIVCYDNELFELPPYVYDERKRAYRDPSIDAQWKRDLAIAVQGDEDVRTVKIAIKDCEWIGRYLMIKVS